MIAHRSSIFWVLYLEGNVSLRNGPFTQWGYLAIYVSSVGAAIEYADVSGNRIYTASPNGSRKSSGVVPRKIKANISNSPILPRALNESALACTTLSY